MIRQVKTKCIYFVQSIFFVLTAFGVTGQIVTIDPAFYGIDSLITVTYDATMGNGGLEGEDQVYIHTGIITEQGGPGNWQNVQGNWGTDDPRVRMINIGNNKHQISYVIRDFYGITGNPAITEFAFVFRNEDGSKEGKTESGGDIFIPFQSQDGFMTFFQSPARSNFVLDQGETLKILVVSSEIADIKIYDNAELIGEAFTDRLELDYLPSNPGDHILKFESRFNEEVVRDSLFFVHDPQVRTLDPPIQLQLGLYRIDEETSFFSLYAPGKEHVFLLSDINEFTVSQAFLMNRSADSATWWIQLDGLQSDRYYYYQYLVDGKLKIADPFSELVLDPVHDGDVVRSSDLPPYPLSGAENIVSIFQPERESFTWNDTNFEPPKKEDLVIYEVLMRDFLQSHSYRDLLDTLSFFKKLGVNAIELMPIQEFEANDSWGYNPSFHMALDKYYGSVTDLKEFINAAHNQDIAIVLDVVYNHAFGQSPLVQLYWDSNLNRPSAESPYFNPAARHPFNVGFDFNHENSATKIFVKRVLQYWIEEFRVDGFRFDLSKGFTQNFSSNNEEMSAYDASRIVILKEYADHIWSLDDDSYVILEHFASNTEERELADYGMMLWGNGNFTINEATMGYHENGKSDFSGLSYQQRNWNIPHLVGYMESHDEERLMYKNVEFGNSGDDYEVQELQTALDRNEMATVFFFLYPWSQDDLAVWRIRLRPVH